MKALKKWFPLISLICGVLALVMIFLPMGSLYGAKNKGIQVCFGDKDEHLAFSIMNTLSFVLALAGGVVAFLGGKTGNKVMKYVAIACFVVAVVLFCLSANFVQFTSDIPSAYAKEFRKDMKAEVGAILAVIFSIIGAASTVCDVVVKD